MILKVKLLGAGTTKDPYHVNLPTYTLVHGNVTQGFAYVSVPDDVHGLTADDLQHEKVEVTTEGPHYPKLCDECVKKANDNLDQRYKEHVGKFRVERG